MARLFQDARNLSPCIVFLDEIDAIFGCRDSSGELSSKVRIMTKRLAGDTNTARDGCNFQTQGTRSCSCSNK